LFATQLVIIEAIQNLFESYKNKLDLKFNNDKQFIQNNSFIDDADKMDILNIAESIVEQMNEILKSFTYNDNIFKNDTFIQETSIQSFDDENVENMIQYFVYGSAWKIIYYIFDNWRNFDVKLIKSNNCIKASFLNKKEILGFKLNNAIKEQTRRNFTMQFLIGSSVYLEKAMDIKKFIHEDERRSARYLYKIFAGFKFNDYVQGIKLKDWLRAYSIVLKYNRNELLKYFKDPYKKKNIIMFKTEDWWIKKFIKYRINKKSAKKLFDYMAYGRKSTDLNDFPFLKINNQIVTIPFISGNIDPGFVLESRLNLKDINFDQKGKSFETQALNLMKDCNVSACSMHNKINGEEYECDMAFYIQDTLFICELKSRLNLDASMYYQYKQNREQDINQLKRIGEFYKNNKNLVIENFKKSGLYIDLTNMKKIKYLLIYSDSVFLMQKEKGVFILDADRFWVPFRRDSIGVRIANSKPDIKDVFYGEYTPEKLFTYYNYKQDDNKVRDKAGWIIKSAELGELKIESDYLYFEELWTD
jgi:hypothetical protein